MPTSRWSTPTGSGGAWQFEARTPLGDAAVHAAHRRPPQRGQRAGGDRLRAGRRRVARQDRRGPGARSSRSRAAPRPRELRAPTATRSRWSTTPTTPTPIRCAPPSTCWPALPAPRLLVLGDMGEVGDQGPQFHAEIGAWAAHARHRDAVRARAPNRRTAWRPSTPRLGDGDGRHFDDIEALNAAVLRAVAARGQRAGQGLALHEDGARGAGDRRAAVQQQQQQGGRSCA